MVDYSKWGNIEVSDDEDDTHPNIDTQSLFRMRHEARLLRMKDMEEEKKSIDKKKEQLAGKKAKIEQMKSSGESVAKLETEYKSEEKVVSQLVSEFAKKERLFPLNVDTIGQDGFSKSVINNVKAQVAADLLLTDEDRSENLHSFIKDNKELLTKFGMLQKYQDSKAFLEDNPQLVSEDTINYLVIWCINLATEEKFDLMNHISHQCITMQFLFEIAKKLECDPRGCISSYFARLGNAEKEQPEYRAAFEAELELFRGRIRRRALERIKEAEEQNEDEYEPAGLGPGGLDPQDVIDTLPEQLKQCFISRDIPMLQKVIAEMPKEEAAYHMKRCADSGLWNPAPDDEPDDEQGASGIQ